MLCFEGGKQSGAEADIGTPAQRNMLMVAQRRMRYGKTAHCEIVLGDRVRERACFLPERADPAAELPLAAIGIRPFGPGIGGWDRPSIRSKRANDIDRRAACEAFEQDAVLADPDRQARAKVFVRGTEAHRARRLPFAAQGFDDAGGGGVQAGIGTGPGKNHEKCSS